MKKVFEHSLTRTASRLLFAFCLIAAFHMSLWAQNPFLMTDANTNQVVPELPGFLYGVNNTLYFDVEGNKGKYLWKSDGTEEGTQQIAKPGIYDGFFDSPLMIDGILYYHSDGEFGEGGDMLWKTDGTVAGTELVTDKVSFTKNFYDYNGSLIFFGEDRISFGFKTWISDGTDAGTLPLVTTIALTAGATINNKFVFANMDDVWVTDGTPTGTIQLKNFVAGSAINKMITYNNAVYFLAWNESVGRSLYKTDGTIAGTVLVKDFSPAGFEEATQLTLLNNKLFMIAQDASHGLELWVSDGTTNGTKMVEDINPGSSDAFELLYSKLYPANGRLYFYADDGIHGKEAWYSDGTAAGTDLLADLTPGSGSSTPKNFTPLGDDVVFSIAGTNLNSTLWITDGSTAGTHLVTFLPTNIPPSFIPISDKVYFQIGDELWSTDGTENGTGPIPINLDETESSTPYQGAAIDNGIIIFAIEDGNSGKYEVWRSDGTSQGSYRIFPAVEGTNVLEIIQVSHTSLNGLAFFDAVTQQVDFSNIHELWRTDGTLNGTFKVAELEPDFSLGTAILNDVLYFVRYYPQTSVTELWRTDGTENGTYQVKDINPAGNDGVAYPITYNGQLFFTASDGSHGAELWKSDGTASGTVLAVDILPGSSSSGPQFLTSANGKIYFSAKQPSGSGNEPWVSDGTAGGTFMLKDINTTTAGKGSDPIAFTVSGPYVYFGAKDNSHGRELWKTDGTSNETVLVKDIEIGKNDFNPTTMVDVNGTLYFTSDDEYAGSGELWKTNGDEASTEQVIKLDDNNSSFTDLTNVEGVLYAVASGSPTELWRTDGTECHTVKIDFFADVVDEMDDILVADGSTLYMALNASATGNELWKFVAPAVTNIEVCNGFDDDCNGIVDDNSIAAISPAGSIEECKGIPVTFSTEPEIGATFQWYKNGNAIAGAVESSFTTKNNESGNFSVAVTGTSNCAAVSDQASLDRLPLPAANITPLGDLDICLTGSVNLQANSGTGFTYQWLKNENAISGATNQVYKAKKKGDYKVVVTNADGCSKTSTKVKVINSCKTGEELETVLDLHMYPNPASSVLNLQFTIGDEPDADVEITNLTGQSVYHGIIQSGAITQINISTLPNGIYMMHLSTGDQSFNKKFIVQQ